MTVIKWAGLFCFIVAAASGCAPRRMVGRPAWVVTHQHEKFPSETYLTGTGEGRTPEQAAQAARDDLTTQLKMRLGIILQEKQQGVSAGSWFNPYRLPPEELAGIAGVEIVHTWNSSDGNRHAALAAVQRSQLAKTSFEKIQAALKSCRHSVEKGDQALKEERHPYQALLLYAQALLDFTRAEKLGVLLQAATGKSLSVPEAPTAQELTVRIDRLLDGVELRSVRGDGQRLNDLGALSSPLVTGAYIHGSTNEFGAFTAHLKKVPTATDRARLVVARIDGERVFSDAGLNPDDSRFSDLLERIKIFETSFRLLAPSQAATRVMMLVDETISGSRLHSSVVLEQFTRALAREGFDLVDPAVLEKPLEAAAPPDQAAAAVAGKTDILVLGSVEASVAQVVTEHFVFARARGKIQAVSAGTGRILAVFEQEVKGAGRDAQSADKRALTTFARKAIRTLLEAIRKQVSKPS
jgi:hypothetical protein